LRLPNLPSSISPAPFTSSSRPAVALESLHPLGQCPATNLPSRFSTSELPGPPGRSIWPIPAFHSSLLKNSRGPPRIVRAPWRVNNTLQLLFPRPHRLAFRSQDPFLKILLRPWRSKFEDVQHNTRHQLRGHHQPPSWLTKTLKTPRCRA
jgi:hypothetical protein